MGRLSARRDHGFSLLEMVVVVAVIATLSVGASLSIRPRGGTADVPRLVSAYDALRDTAVLGQMPRGLRLVPGGWQVLVPVEGEQEGAEEGWQPSGKPVKFRSEVRFEGVGGPILPAPEGRAPRPDIVFLPDGKVTPFEAVFVTDATITACRAQGLAGLECAVR